MAIMTRKEFAKVWRDGLNKFVSECAEMRGEQFTPTLAQEEDLKEKQLGNRDFVNENRHS